MKALLWLVLAAAIIVNVSTSFAFDGVQQVLISVGTGVTAIAIGAFLFATRRRASA
ncbi:hypothetical protein AB0J38_26585 [Streptomyces sp. NPDC050095]|uniref:hypothetical protein n=1 Tax=unclassified Streptomyces TaxID=2593676 RepID=UPI0034127390